MDAARLLPILGFLLVMVPILWGSGEARPSTSSAILYLFGVWVVLVVLAFIVSARLRHYSEDVTKAKGQDEAQDGSV